MLSGHSRSTETLSNNQAVPADNLRSFVKAPPKGVATDEGRDTYVYCPLRLQVPFTRLEKSITVPQMTKPQSRWTAVFVK